jgi:hypothetical protein
MELPVCSVEPRRAPRRWHGLCFGKGIMARPQPSSPYANLPIPLLRMHRIERSGSPPPRPLEAPTRKFDERPSHIRELRQDTSARPVRRDFAGNDGPVHLPMRRTGASLLIVLLVLAGIATAFYAASRSQWARDLKNRVSGTSQQSTGAALHVTLSEPEQPATAAPESLRVTEPDAPSIGRVQAKAISRSASAVAPSPRHGAGAERLASKRPVVSTAAHRAVQPSKPKATSREQADLDKMRLFGSLYRAPRPSG